MTEDEWKEQAKNLLKSELTRRGINYKDLVLKLNAAGVKENYNSVNNKMSRGTFSFVFALQCLKAIGAEEIRLQLGRE